MTARTAFPDPPPFGKDVPLNPLDRETRAAFRAAHDEGRHGDGSSLTLLAYWAKDCADCNATWRYEYGSGRHRAGGAR